MSQLSKSQSSTVNAVHAAPHSLSSVPPHISAAQSHPHLAAAHSTPKYPTGSHSGPGPGPLPTPKVPVVDDYGLPPFSCTLAAEQDAIMDILNMGFDKMPHPRDTFEPTFYRATTPYGTPHCFPQIRRRMFDESLIFGHMDLETLFFVFYYQSGSNQQYMAAKELKTRGWSYNTKFSAWFQRHYNKSKPKEDIELAKGEVLSLKGKGQHVIVGGKYEKGTYIFFSRDSSWQMRMRENFKFDYSCLEDDKAVNVDDKLDWNKLATYGNGCGLIYGEQKQAMRYQQHQQRKQNAAMSRSKQQQISQIQSKSRRQSQLSSSSKSGNASSSRSMMRNSIGGKGPPPHSLNASQPPPSASSSSSKMTMPPMSMASSKGRYTNSSSHS